MRINLFIFSICSLMLASCEKEELSAVDGLGTASAKMTNAELAKVPATFSQKLLMEMYSTAGCATCPDAEYKHHQYANAHPDKIYGVCIHNSDAMDHPQYDVLDSCFNIGVYSSGSFNRLPFSNSVVLPKTSWNNTVVNTCLGKTASCGIKLVTAINGTSAEVIVTGGFNTSLQGNYRLTVYLIEDSVSGPGSGYNQANYYNNIQSSPFYMQGNPIIGYQHAYVLRKVITPALGEIIPQSAVKPGGSVMRNYTVNISGYDASQLYILAFINKTGNTSTTHEIMNVQRVKLGLTKMWD